ncbi:Acetyltransferase (GNAT) family [Actinobacillus pleuropneumoniae]|nr:Acetyltransferase (GNAT) family [Actinobacillus pleuropneumoniae]
MKTSIEVRAYQGALPSEFSSSVPPELRDYLRVLPPNCIALGAIGAGMPLGLAIAKRNGTELSASLQALVITESCRRQGIGRQLYGMLESLLRQQGIRWIRTEYLGSSHVPSLEASFLQSCGFPEPAPGIHVWNGSFDILKELPRIQSLKLPGDYLVIPFHELTSKEREKIARGNWYPPILDPFTEEDVIDRQRSLALRYRNAIIGWLILEPFHAQTLLFKTMFVSQSHQRTGRGIALLAEASRRIVREGQYKDWIFFVEADNAAMVRFMQRRIHHPNVQKEILWRTVKAL